ncbi:HNH endonuclease [Micromonospora sp. NPDC049044]|uniref:HNH endonuclease n=1 Tax=Micromonospora sp. NPDC049044 TaxID=3154827 RepID=UPI0033C8C68E
MGLADVTRSDVLAAAQEFDKLGRDAFLDKYGFGSARTYFLEVNGRQYDSKAIMGYAHGVSQGEFLRSGDFTGGEASVVHHLRRLGFVIRTHRNPPWTWDEVVLACSLVRDNGWRWLTPNDARVVELSELLQLYTAHPIEERGPDFRNPNGVARKTADIATQHPNYTGKPTNGGRYDPEVLMAFLDRPAEMEQQATAIRQAILDESAGPAEVADVDLDGLSADEGRVLQRLHLRRERDPKLRRKVIEAHKRRHAVVACEACGFDFQKTYGDRGTDYIECHHRTPLHVSGPTRTRPEDLMLLCSNCHRMIHRSSPWLTPEELISLIERHRSQ